MPSTDSPIASCSQVAWSPDLGGQNQATIITGTEDDDILSATSGRCKFFGLGGDDTLIGGSGGDTLVGGDGGDFLLGSSGKDKLNGGRGDDYLRGGAGSDTLDGGAGHDVGSIYVGGDRPVFLDLSGFVAGENFSIKDGLGGVDTFVSIEEIDVLATSGDDTIMGSSGNNTISTAGGNDYIDAGAGDDLISDYGGDATLIGGAGDDWIKINGRTYFGQEWGFAGGHDVIDAGDGFDTVSVDWSRSSGEVTVVWDNDSVEITLGSGDASETISGLEALSFRGGTGGATISGGSSGDLLYGGSSAQNLIDGRGGDDTIRGGAANDILNGGKGVDLYVLEHGAYDAKHDGYLFDLSGFDVSGATQTVSDFQGGIDTLTHFEGVEVYTNGDDRRDTVLGSGGNDVIHDSLGTDDLAGGDGDDLILQASNYSNGKDIRDVADTLDGGAGIDTLSFEFAAWMDGPTGWAFDLAAGTVAASATGVDVVSGFEHVIGSASDDTIAGSSANETLEGGDGEDRIDGRAGGDVLTGGADSDVFIYETLADSSGRAIDLITDLEASDLIDLSAIDADTKTAGDQAFHLVSAFTHHAGELVLSYDGAHKVTHLTADVDGDGHADFAINLSGDQHQFDGFVL